jgi:two-component system, NarL family, invasion response regulator UvrY
MKTTVMFADDHPLLVQGFSAAIDSDRFEVVGTTTEASQVINMFEERAPQVVVLDMRFGDEGLGSMCAEVILEKHENARIVFLSQFAEIETIKEAYRIGAMAYLTKDCSVTELETAIERAGKGETFFMPKVMERLALSAISGEKSPQELLTRRQLEMFIEMARGKTQQEIATKHELTLRALTPDFTVIKEKLKITRPAQATLIALRYNLISPRDDLIEDE